MSVIAVTLKNHQLKGGKRQVQKAVSLDKPKVEALLALIDSADPQSRRLLSDLYNSLMEVSVK